MNEGSNTSFSGALSFLADFLLYLTSVLNEVGFFPRGSSRSEETHDGKIQFG